MTKLPRVTGNQLIKYLINKKGFRQSHQKGSHVSLRNDISNRFTSVPAKNKELGTGLTRQILEDCGITRNEFVQDYQDGAIK
ncbi:MAG TPA: type II toxin-antitoxin system HicA family toxin [Candidatus Nitrosotalea sp.]|nr:type II toxin-antitoxin system HicA family toxin [Candidatus Nitrosotalea sp.]